MKKRLLLVSVFVAVCCIVHPQTISHPEPDKIAFNGYTIHLQKTPSGGYVYDISSKAGIILHQNTNPFTGSSLGLTKKEDAIKTAKWQIIHLVPVNAQPVSGPQRIAVEVAKQLSISLD
jgi:hypothetical protein